MAPGGLGLATATARLLDGAVPAEVAAAAQEMSERYRAGSSSVVRDRMDALAYAAVRMPATFAAAAAALDATSSRLGGFSPATQLDLGAGPGTAVWAGVAAWPSITNAVLWETNTHMAALGRDLAGIGLVAPECAWRHVDAASGAEEMPSADLVTASYFLGELGAAERQDVLLRAFEVTAGCLVVVEAGTPAGYSVVLEARSLLLAEGAILVAPCPDDGACPVAEGDWCHFAARVGRTALHRRAKNGKRSFEDEKFSYVAVAWPGVAGERAAGRVVRRVERRRRLVELTVCSGGTLRRLAVGQSEPAYRDASRLEWGDAVPPGVLLEEPGEPPVG